MKPLQITLTFISLLIISASFGQSFKYRDLKVKHDLKATAPFRTEFKTITVRIHGEAYVKPYGILASEIIDVFNFRKYETVEKEGDLHLDIFIDQPKYVGVTKQNFQETEDEKKVTYYYYKGALATPISYELRDGARNLIEEKIAFSMGDHSTFNTETFRNSTALVAYWKESQNVVISKEFEAKIRENIATIASDLKNRFDDSEIEHKYIMFDVKGAEKINAVFVNEAFTNLKSGVTANPNMSAWEDSKRNEIISSYEKGLSFDPLDKKKRVVYAAAAYNLATLNTIWANYDAALKYISKGRRAGRKNYEFDNLKLFVEKAKKRISTKDPISEKDWTATYQLDADKKLPPLRVVELNSDPTPVVAAEKEVFIPTDTMVMLNDEVIIGQLDIVIVQGNGDLATPKIDRIMVTPAGGGKELKVQAKDVKHIDTEGTRLYPIATAAGIKSPIFFYEVLQASKNEKLYLFEAYYHPSMPERFNNMDKLHVLVKTESGKNGKPKVLNVSSGLQFTFGINNGLRKNFEECPEIVANCENKKYEDGEYSLKTFVDDYDKCHP